MSRTYSKRTCWLCKTQVSAAGGAFAAHLKKHAKAGGDVGTQAKQYLDERKSAHLRDYLRRHGVSSSVAGRLPKSWGGVA